MSRLSFGYKGALSHSDIIQLLHDEVVSLCQRSYGTATGLEIDGLICISILDTKEQQVVKIHKTLKSVFADAKKKNKKQKIDTQPPLLLQGTQGNTCLPPTYGEQGPENLQNDITALSNLLRDTNAAINKELSTKETAPRASKRKRKLPQQRVSKDSTAVTDEPNSDKHKSSENEKSSKVLSPLPGVADFQSSPGVNPFIHKDIVQVKEEKVDPEYDVAEQTQPKIVHVSSVAEVDNENTETSGVGVERKKVSSLIDSIIEKEIPRDRGSEERDRESQEKDVTSGEGSSVEKEMNDGKCGEESSEFQAVEVKVEVNTDDSEYGGSQQYDDNVSKALGSGGNNSDVENFECSSNWLYNERSPVNEIGTSALLDKNEDTDSDSHIICYPKGPINTPGYRKDAMKTQPDPHGKSWIELVKDNVNKYQAALERSGRGKSEGEITKNSKDKPQALAEASSLIALLKKAGPAIPMSKELATKALLDSAPCSRGPSMPRQGDDQSVESNSSPVVKIEVDEEMIHEMYSQSYEDDAQYTTKERTSSAISNENNVQANKGPQGKLESRYPALFSHLQQGKQGSFDGQDSADSLVNRLPFISFQELFSQAATGGPSPRLSESTTMQLLAQARINPYPSKEKGKTQRKVWNWKKRQVRPRDADGKLLSVTPGQVKSPEVMKRKKFLGIPSSMRKTFSKRGQKEEDIDWKPDADNADRDSDNNDGIHQTNRKTRLSCGEKPRINFAELDNSDIEIAEEEDFIDIDMFEASGQKTFMDYQDDVNPLVYTERHDENNGAFSGGGSEQILASFSTSSEQLNSASGTSTEQYKCSLCGLEFNQEYRWNYHLIKVHGITEEKVNLFR